MRNQFIDFFIQIIAVGISVGVMAGALMFCGYFIHLGWICL